MNSKSVCMMLILLMLGIVAFSQEINLDENTNGNTITTCNATLYDSGGRDGNYSNNENYTITFCSSSDFPMLVEVLSMKTEGDSFDYIRLYDGENTSGELMAILGGSLSPLQVTEYVASGSCVTIQWHSDGGVSYSGFELNIRCEMPCQEYSVSITSNAQYDATENAFLGCSGNTISAELEFSHNNENYEQTIENTFFSWKVLSNNGTQIYSGIGMNELSEPFEQGAYFVTLTTTDSNGCQEETDTLVAYISVPPMFTGTAASQSVYLGDTVELNGIVVPPDEWQMDANMMSVNNERLCLYGMENVEQTRCFNFVGYASDLTITSSADIQSVGVNMEYSYIGDLDILLQCPTGQRISLFSQSCGGSYFGEPIDYDDVATYPCEDEWVGLGYDYYWTEGENNGLMSENCQGNAIPLPSGSYLPVGNFSDLEGCPINGEWCLVFIGHNVANYGTVFKTELNFADYIMPSVSYQNTFGDQMWWEGENILNDGYVANNIAVPSTVGQVEYIFSATDNFGCTYDTTLYVNVLPATNIDEISDDDIILFPNPVNDLLTITSSETISEIEIVNSLGQVVYRMVVNADNAVCDVDGLANGVYVVRIHGTDTASIICQRKFIKE